jgi:competence protein ComGC
MKIIELLIIISIIFILVALLATSLSKAKISAQRAQCLNNARVLNMIKAEDHSIIFGFNYDNRYIKKMRNYGDVIVVNCYSCHPQIIDFDRKEKLYPDSFP